MKQQHATDEQLQQYACGDMLADEVRMHIEKCAACTTVAASYGVLMNQLHNAGPAQLDFDVSSAVLSLLPEVKKQEEKTGLIVGIVITIAVVIAAGLLYLLRAQLSSLAGIISPAVGYIVVPSMVCLALVSGSEVYRSYRKKLDTLKIV